MIDDKFSGKIYDYDKNIIFDFNNENAKIEEIDKNIIIFIGKNLDEEKLEGNVIGKEYDYNGRLLFDGEYLNKRRWKGKVMNYIEDELTFVGEYLNGEIWSGKGEKYDYDYDYNENFLFKGEYISGKKN